MHRTIRLPPQGHPTEGREFSASTPDSHWLKAVPRTGNIHPLALLALCSGSISKRKPSDKEMDAWHWEISRDEGSSNVRAVITSAASVSHFGFSELNNRDSLYVLEQRSILGNAASQGLSPTWDPYDTVQNIVHQAWVQKI